MKTRWQWEPAEIPADKGRWSGILADTWSPLIQLTPATDKHPLKLGNISYLLDQLATPTAARTFPLASYLSPPEMRSWVALRAGRPELAFERLPTTPLAGARWQLLQHHVDQFNQLDTYDKAWVISTLSQLTLYHDCIQLAQGEEFDLDQTADAALAYELARALQRVEVGHALPVLLFKEILDGQADPYLRAACAIQFMVRGSRYVRDSSMAIAASQQGEALLMAEHAQPREPFRHAIMCSRFYRADALVRVIHGGPRSPAEAITLSWQWHHQAESLCDHTPEQLQIAKENKRLIVEASLKAATRAGLPEGEKFAQALMSLDGQDPDCLAFVGDFWLARGDWRLASAYHLRAMRRGTTRSVISAIVAGDLCIKHGLHAPGLKAYRHALRLDARSITARTRISELECPRGETMDALSPA